MLKSRLLRHMFAGSENILVHSTAMQRLGKSCSLVAYTEYSNKILNCKITRRGNFARIRHRLEDDIKTGQKGTR